MSQTKMSRRVAASLLTAALLGAGLTACSDDGDATDQHVLVAGHQLAVGTPFDLGLERFAELVEEKTDGRVRVDVHPNAQLGNETEMYQGLESGTLDVGIFAPGSIAEFVPEMTILSLPFLVTSREQRDALLDSDVITELEQILADGSGAVPLTYFGGSYRQMFFTAPVSGVEDLQGRLFRVQPSAVLTDSYAATGLEPTVIAYNELYNALQQGVVDGAENESVFIDSQKFYEPAPYIAQTNHEVTIRPVLIAQSTLDELGPELAELVLEAGVEAGEYERATEAEMDDETLEALRGRDDVTVSEIDIEPLIASVEPVWRSHVESWGLESMLESIIAMRGESS